MTRKIYKTIPHQLTEEDIAKRKLEEEHRGYDVYMEGLTQGEHRYPVKKEGTHITDEEKKCINVEREKTLIRTLGAITYKDFKMLGLI